ncbi:MAG: protoheme IX farnesyltransferase [Actinobacteria bacterium]|nr:protoheme IX farnesyltransferase [Actinomycetota bacterium]
MDRWLGRCDLAPTGGYPVGVTQTPIAPESVVSQSVAFDAPRVPVVGPGTASLRTRVGAYVALTKPRIIELLLVTTLPAMILAAHGLPSWSLVVATLVGGTLAAGSANALNCYVDRDIDALMRRTGHRPLARHDVTPRAALAFGCALAVIAVTLMGSVTNWLAAGLTALAIAFYVVVYTMVLKRRTAQNIVWGGAAGCMPVLIGWAAVTDRLAWAPVVMFGIIFFWTPPHFWALAIRYRDDYERAGVPMLPVVATQQRVARDIVGYAWLTVATSLLLWPLATGWVYALLAGAAGACLLYAAHRLYRRTVTGKSPKPMQLFHLSNSYLAFVFVAIAVDTFLR